MKMFDDMKKKMDELNKSFNSGFGKKKKKSKRKTTSKTQKYLETFFEEKNLPLKNWDIIGKDGEWNNISNEVVIEYILKAPEYEQKKIANKIRKIDFYNGDVNDFLKHLAKGIVMNR